MTNLSPNLLRMLRRLTIADLVPHLDWYHLPVIDVNDDDEFFDDLEKDVDYVPDIHHPPVIMFRDAETAVLYKMMFSENVRS